MVSCWDYFKEDLKRIIAGISSVSLDTGEIIHSSVMMELILCFYLTSLNIYSPKKDKNLLYFRTWLTLGWNPWHCYQRKLDFGMMQLNFLGKDKKPSPMSKQTRNSAQLTKHNRETPPRRCRLKDETRLSQFASLSLSFPLFISSFSFFALFKNYTNLVGRFLHGVNKRSCWGMQNRKKQILKARKTSICSLVSLSKFPEKIKHVVEIPS